MTLVAALLLGTAIGAVLGALGGGGAILTVPVLVYVLGESAQQATAGSLVVVGATAALGLVGPARRGEVRWGAGLALAGTGAAAAWAGTQANRLVDEQLLLLLFAGLMVVAATAMLARLPGRGPQPDIEGGVEVGIEGGVDGGAAHRRNATMLLARPSTAARVARVVAAGMAVGALTGFFGVGGGFVVVPALVLVLGLPMSAAVGTSLLVVALNSAVALFARAGHAPVDWAVVLPLTVTAVAGTVVGQRLARRVSGEALTVAFALVLLVVAAVVGVQSATALL